MKATYLAVCPLVQPLDPEKREDYARSTCTSCGRAVWFGRLSILNPTSALYCRECIHDPA
jgi:late competence protein required for DNA uptake (superfamily II DNA/RNA helicase)